MDIHEMQQYSLLRAMEWLNFPTYISPLFVPILMFKYNVFSLLVALFVISLVWTQIRYSFTSEIVSSLASIIVPIAKWPICLFCAYIFYDSHRTLEAIVSAIWPIGSILLVIPGEIGKIQGVILEKMITNRGKL